VRLLRSEGGAWARTKSPNALAWVENASLIALGLEPTTTQNQRKRALLESHLAITTQCPVGCSGCYQSAEASGEHVAFEVLQKRLDEIAAAGAMTVAFGGGEPILHPDVAALGRHAKDLGLSVVLTTSGFGLSQARAESLTVFDQINVSYDGLALDYSAVRGVDGADHAERAIARLAALGVHVGVNVVLTNATFPNLSTTLERARTLGAKEAQLLRYKPIGRARNASYAQKRLTVDQRQNFAHVLEVLSQHHYPHFSIRIDCALVPFLVAGDRVSLEAMQRFGIFGCEAGRHLSHVKASGVETGCSFLAPGEEVMQLEEPCLSCKYAAVCRGGCQAVSYGVSGAGRADPECLRVLAWSAERENACSLQKRHSLPLV
jgi:radical SAM protein with 4Fe4S-binding SPASM domain